MIYIHIYAYIEILGENIEPQWKYIYVSSDYQIDIIPHELNPSTRFFIYLFFHFYANKL